MIRAKITLSAFFVCILLFFCGSVYAVTYQEVQEDPINLSLNLKYAKEQ
ncbi:uncharacterized protein METZ01_LOCUS159995, partial [marine metagenome]